MSRKYVSFAVLAACLLPCAAQEEPRYEPARMMATVQFLASDAMGGRKVGTPEGIIAGEYVASRFAALGLERLLSDLAAHRGRIEALQALGAEPWEATRGLFRDALRAAMIPTINALMVVGIVSLPGMMTGQILAGVDPLLAVKYQLVVMLMLASGTALGSLLLLLLALRRCFDERQRLVIEQVAPAR